MYRLLKRSILKRFPYIRELNFSIYEASYNCLRIHHIAICINSLISKESKHYTLMQKHCCTHAENRLTFSRKKKNNMNNIPNISWIHLLKIGVLFRMYGISSTRCIPFVCLCALLFCYLAEASIASVSFRSTKIAKYWMFIIHSSAKTTYA